METYPRAFEADPEGKLRQNFLALEAHAKAFDANLGAMEAHPETILEPLRPTLDT
jgi:hypothetical protein